INENGKVVRTGRGSGGKSYCSDIRRGCKTPSGVYRIISKGGPGCKSSRYPLGGGGAPMPYCMFFSKYYAVHGSYDVPNYNASHGCVRVKPNDAQWLSKNFMKIGTKVVIKPY
ncbi:L,D-transpeptidase, partial [uncultured Legionella sp.]|uniref:L,D-transpeptidase n=1 Tax=uncultured Legionella sp. TaxID=210934 RepID=UPI0026391661